MNIVKSLIMASIVVLPSCDAPDAVNTQNLIACEEKDKKEFIGKIKFAFPVAEYGKIKGVIKDYCNPENPLKPTGFDAVNQSLFFIHKIDDDTFIPRLIESGLFEESGRSVSARKLTGELFDCILENLSGL